LGISKILLCARCATLKECDVVAAETRDGPGLLLRHFEISKPLLSYFPIQRSQAEREILERLARGEKVVLVTDAGSPGISDPGERVVKGRFALGFVSKLFPDRRLW